ncbi:MAG: hemerythrin domain-containing protein [Synergistaceae bacterium]|nr:hemerythrin domain-containing protein [Synergistaceae bacterium]
MDILKEIKKEHEEFRNLAAAIENSQDKKKKQLFEELYVNLFGHHEAEEHVLFPDVKKNSDDEGKDIVREMIEEHDLLVYQLSVIQKTPLTDETWNAKFSILKELLIHHLDEEEKSLFKQAKKVLGEEVLKAKYEPFEVTMEKYKGQQENKLKSQ